jgi:hypothetical protein
VSGLSVLPFSSSFLLFALFLLISLTADLFAILCRLYLFSTPGVTANEVSKDFEFFVFFLLTAHAHTEWSDKFSRFQRPFLQAGHSIGCEDELTGSLDRA